MSDETRYPPHCQMMRQALKRKDWEQAIVAMVMDQSLSTVNAILTGKQRLSARNAVDYGHALDLSPENLLRAQNAWLSSICTVSEAKLAAIRQRAATVTARVAGDAQAEINSLQKERDLIDARIAHLRSLLVTEDAVAA